MTAVVNRGHMLLDCLTYASALVEGNYLGNLYYNPEETDYMINSFFLNSQKAP